MGVVWGEGEGPVSQRGRAADAPADALDGHGADLLGLGLGVAVQAGLGGGQQNPGTGRSSRC